MVIRISLLLFFAHILFFTQAQGIMKREEIVTQIETALKDNDDLEITIQKIFASIQQAINNNIDLSTIHITDEHINVFLKHVRKEAEIFARDNLENIAVDLQTDFVDKICGALNNKLIKNLPEIALELSKAGEQDSANEMLDLLLRSGISPNIKNAEGVPLLVSTIEAACLNGNVYLVQTLLKYKVDVKIPELLGYLINIEDTVKTILDYYLTHMVPDIMREKNQLSRYMLCPAGKATRTIIIVLLLVYGINRKETKTAVLLNSPHQKSITIEPATYARTLNREDIAELLDNVVAIESR